MPVESADDLAGMFDTADHAVSAIYRVGGAGLPVAVGVIPSQPTADFNQARSGTASAMLTAASLGKATARRGDTLAYGGAVYRVEAVEVGVDAAVLMLTLSAIA